MKKIIILLGIFSIVIMSCERDITKLDVDPKTATNVPAANVFAGGIVSLANQMNTTSVGSNQFRGFVQQLADVQYLELGRYDQRKRSIPDNHWNSLYGQLQNFESAKNAVTKEGGASSIVSNKLAIIEIMQIYCWQVLVDSFGNVPYTQALNISQYQSPKYDDAKTIYIDLLKRIDNSISKLDVASGSFGGDDLVYAGNVTKWKKFAAALKIKLGINLADVDLALSKSAVESGYQIGTFSNESESARVKYNATGIYQSPTFTDLFLSGRVDYCAADTYMNVLIAKNDPRIASYFTQVNGQFLPGVFGKTNPTAETTLSLINPKVYPADAYGYFADYIEIEYILAEAAARGYNVGGDAATHFKNALSASMDLWGVSTTDKATYLASNDYNLLTGTFKEKIGNQAWLSMFNRGFEAWSFMRRLDAPALTTKNSTSEPLPMRLLYPIKEKSVNEKNVNDAIQQLPSKKDIQSDKIFWDKF